MLKFSANLSMLFTEFPFMERFAAAAGAGFDAVEFMFPYDYDVTDLRAELTRNNLRLVLINLPAGNWGGGDRGIAANPGRAEEFRAGVARAVEAAKYLGVPRVNCLVGRKPEGEMEGAIRQTTVSNLRLAAEALAAAGIDLMVEPVNHLDVPGFYINTTSQALQMIAEVDRPNVYLQYDLYHAAREGENLPGILEKLAKIGHIQVADHPGRHQPGTGTIDFKNHLAEIDRLGYRGFVGLEYIPDPDTLTSLQWLADFGFGKKGLTQS